MYPRITDAIREVDSETPILIGGLSWSGVAWLPYLKPTGDSRTIYTVHQYEPQEQYTHQIADASGNLPNTYPGSFDTNWDGEDDDFNEVWISDLLVTVDDFKALYGVPVAATEYGLIRWEPGAGQFLHDEMAQFEESGMNYAIWSWQPAIAAYNAVHNDFNFRLGIEPSNLMEGNWDLFNTLKQYWARNVIRPSSLLNQ
jgi:hypothetical protein